jgi:pimeloyl-ACP methyl ester carboxylesterase
MAASPQTLPGDGLRLSCDVYGNENSPTVLLLHGGGQTRHSWQAAAQALQATGMCAIAVDLRGHGDSDWAPADRYEIGNFASDVARICKALPAPPVIVGASLGGLAALIAVGESPVLIARALVLVDIAPRIESDGSRRVLSFMSSGATGFADLTAAAEAVAAYQVHRRRPADPGGLLRNLRQRPDGRWYWHWDPAFLNQRISVDRSAQSPEHLRLAGAARKVSVPTLLVHGNRSDVVSAESIGELRNLIPHAQVASVPGAGHMVAGDRNDLFNEAITGFIGALDHPGLHSGRGRAAALHTASHPRRSGWPSVPARDKTACMPGSRT